MSYPSTLSSVIKETLKEFGLDKKARSYSVITGWAEVVGEKIANAAVAEKLDHGVLTVRVTSPAWRYELTMNKQAILNKIEAAFGPGLVKDIQWRV
jgi:predicted nucleic acid-binding Zn ribbon protein